MTEADPYAELEAVLAPLRAAQPGITNQEVAPLLPKHLRSLLWERAIDRYLEDELAAPVKMRQVCCDSHNEHCEPPAELCCDQCTEVAHDTFPTRHADGSTCVLDAAR